MPDGWIGVTAGLISASVTLGFGFLLEDYKRHRDRQAMATAYIGEIEAVVRLSGRLQLRQQATTIADNLRPLDELPAGFGAERVAIANPVFDKSADKIGMFPGDIPALLAEFYNQLTGLRSAFFGALAFGPTSIQGRVAALNFVAEHMSELEMLASERLLPQLRAVSQQRWKLGSRAVSVLR